MPEVHLKKIGDSSYEAETPSGSVKFGGTNAGPMDTVAASLAGCLAISLTKTLTVMRQSLHDLEIRMTFERKKEEPKIFDHFNIHFTFRGDDLSPAKIEKAIHMAEESVCPVSVILELSGAQMRTTFMIENTGQKG